MKPYLLTNDVCPVIKPYFIDGNYYTYTEVLLLIKQWRLDLYDVCPINFIASTPGSGKTAWAIKKMLKNTREKKSVCLYIAPTINLIDQIMSDWDVNQSFIEHGNFHRIVFDNQTTADISFGVNITSRDDTETIRDEFLKKFKKAKLGDSFLITHTTFLNLQDVIQCKDYPISVIFDEDCEMVKGTSAIEFSYTLDEKNLLTHLFLEKTDLEISSNEGSNSVYRLNLTDISRVTQLAKQKFFSLEDLKLIDLLINKKVAVYAVYQDNDVGKKTIRFNLISLVSENIFVGFTSVTILNSYFEKSMMYHILSKRHRMINRSYALDSSDRNEMLNQRIAKLAIYPLLKGNTALSKNSLTNFISLNDHAHVVLLQFYKKLCFYSRKRISVEVFLTSVQHNLLFSSLDARTDISLKFFKDIFSGYIFPDRDKKNQTYRLVVKYLDKIVKHIITENNRFSYQLPILGAMNTALSIIKAMRTVENHDDISLVVQRQFPYSKFNRINSMYATPTLFITNKSSVGKLVKSSFSHLSSLTNISVKSHGLNGYENNNAVIYLAALNPSPLLNAFMTAFTPDYSFKEHWVVSTILQCLYRTSLRSPHRTDLIHLVVPNQEIAELTKCRLNGLPTIHLVDDTKQCRLVTPSNFISNEDKKELFSQLKLTSHRHFYESATDKERHKKRVGGLEKLARAEEAKKYQKITPPTEENKVVVKREIEALLSKLNKEGTTPVSKVEVKAFEDKRRRTLRMLEDKYSLDEIHEEIIAKELEQEMTCWAMKRQARAVKNLGISANVVK